MSDTSPTSPYGAPLGELAGTADFRLMPTDEFAGGASTLTVAEVAAGRAVLLTYTWIRAEDGPQTGTLMVGVPGDEGSITAAWVDSWHQRDVGLLTGSGDATSATVGYEYAPGWRWEIEVRVVGDSVELAMHNLVPEREAEPAVRYDVMRATWS